MSAPARRHDAGEIPPRMASQAIRFNSSLSIERAGSPRGPGRIRVLMLARLRRRGMGQPPSFMPVREMRRIHRVALHQDNRTNVTTEATALRQAVGASHCLLAMGTVHKYDHQRQFRPKGGDSRKSTVTFSTRFRSQS
jgi:hypothetical protein